METRLPETKNLALMGQSGIDSETKLPAEEPEFRQEADGRGQAGVGSRRGWGGGREYRWEYRRERREVGMRAERKLQSTFKAGCQNSTIIRSAERVKARGCAVIYLKSRKITTANPEYCTQQIYLS